MFLFQLVNLIVETTRHILRNYLVTIEYDRHSNVRIGGMTDIWILQITYYLTVSNNKYLGLTSLIHT